MMKEAIFQSLCRTINDLRGSTIVKSRRYQGRLAGSWLVLVRRCDRCPEPSGERIRVVGSVASTTRYNFQLEF